MADFWKKFVDDLKDEDTSIASEGKSPAEFQGFIDTGSYIVNAAVSGSLFGGIPNNKAILFAGDPVTGKTFFALGIVKNFLDTHKDARVFYFDTESAVTQKMMVDRGIDPSRIAVSAPSSIQGFRNTAVKLLDHYAELEPMKRFPALLVLDSLSMLPSRKEIQDIDENKETKDMTKPGEIKGAFRILRLKMAKVGIAMIVTNHVYAAIGAYGNQKVIGGGSGAIYASDTIVMLSKKQDKVDDERIGNIIHVRMLKSRLSREETRVDTRILYNGGLDRYYGLLEYAEAAGLVKKVATRYEFPDGSKVFEKAINKNPEKYFTDEFLKKLDVYIQPQFQYTIGPSGAEVEVDDAADSGSE
jgi:RecA/RadA recombinase